MYLQNIKLWNFRKFGRDENFDINSPDLNLNFNKGLNVIIGENDSGKTAIIDAIKCVLKTHSYDYIKIEEKDFYGSSDRLRIELTFKNLVPEEAKNFIEWLSWEGNNETAQPILKLNYDIKRIGKKIFNTDVKAGIDDDGYILTTEAKEYLKTTYLKPLRDAENELIAKRNSRLSQILIGDSAFKGKENDHELLKIFHNLSLELKNYFKGDFKIPLLDENGVHIQSEDGEFQFHIPLEGKEIKQKIDGYIKSFYGENYETDFLATSGDLKNVLEKLSLLLKDEFNPGLGTLNRLFMAAELLHLNKSNWDGLRLGLIEELEAHLHPQAQMQIIEALQKQEKIQLILTTHSPNLASKLKLDSLIICNNKNAFPMGSDYTKLDNDNYKFLEKFLDVTKSNLFFAKGLIFVEGWAEELLIPSISKCIGINLTEKGVSVINVGNIGFQHYANIFLRQEEPNMKIPVSIITDSDVREYEKIGDDYQRRDSGIIAQELGERIADNNLKSVNNVKYFIAHKWTLEYSLYKSQALSNIFQNTVKNIHNRTDWETDFEKTLAEKLIDKNKKIKKTEIAYKIATLIDEDLAKDLPERIINILQTKRESINYIIKAIKYASGYYNR